MKILFIHHATGWGGAPLSLMSIIINLRNTYNNIEVLLIRDSIVRKILEENNIKVKLARSIFYKKFYNFYVHSDANIKKWYRIDLEIVSILSWLLSRYYFAARELRLHEYDIVHLNSSTLTDWLAPSKTKGKVVIHIREPFSKGRFGLRHSFLTKQMSDYADKIIAISIDNSKRINIPEKTCIVYNFVNGLNQRSECEFASSPKSFALYLGGYHEIKGFFTVVDSLDYLKEGVKIAFCGDYLTNLDESGLVSKIKSEIKKILPYHSKLKKALLKIKSHPHALYIGMVNDPTLIIKESEFLISPFLKPHFSRPIIEAFSFNKCVICSNVEGVKEIVDHQLDGLIIEKNDSVGLAEAINYLHEHVEKRDEMGRNGYQKAIKLFSDKNIAQIEKIYDELLKTK